MVDNLTVFERKLFFIIGLTCTWNALIIGGLSFYNYLVIVWIFYKIITTGKTIKIYKTSYASTIVLFFLLSIFMSIIVAYVKLPSSWANNSVKNAIKYIMVFGMIFLLNKQKEIIEIREILFNGVYVGAIVQMIWGYIQFIAFSFAKIKINTLIFGELLGIKETSGSKIVWDSYVGGLNGAILRMKGIGWETANFALVLIIGYILSIEKKKSKSIQILFIIAILLSTSRSGWFALACVFGFKIMRFLTSRKKKIQLNGKIILSILLVVAMLIFIYVFMGNHIYTYILSMFNNMASAFDKSNMDISSSLHRSYYEYIIQIIKMSSLLSLLFGYGYFSAGYVASLNIPSFYSGIKNVGWNPESDFITLILGNGLFGTIIYYYSMIKALIYHYKDSYALILVAIIAEGITYLTIRGTWSLLLVIFIMADIP